MGDDVSLCVFYVICSLLLVSLRKLRRDRGVVAAATAEMSRRPWLNEATWQKA